MSTASQQLFECTDCGTTLSPSALVCPSCQRLVHADALRQMSTEAKLAGVQGNRSEELRLWRAALDLLPRESRQYQTISTRVLELSKAVDTGVPEPDKGHHRPEWLKILGPLAPVLLLAWKFKAILLALLTKGKLLLFGLSKFSTFSTMLLSLGAYWALYGWWFALGLVLAIYVHEMGHVYALRQFGFAASAPTFIPLLGAFVRMKQHPINPTEDARVGLAGPIWGTTAAIFAFIVYAATGTPVIGVVAHFAAWLNLFNLLPVWQLDGARGMRALSRRQRAILVGVLLATWVATREGFLIILAALAIWRLFTRDWPEEGDDKALLQFCGLIIVLGVLLAIPTPIGLGR